MKQETKLMREHVVWVGVVYGIVSLGVLLLFWLAS